MLPYIKTSGRQILNMKGKLGKLEVLCGIEYRVQFTLEVENDIVVFSGCGVHESRWEGKH